MTAVKSVLFSKRFLQPAQDGDKLVVDQLKKHRITRLLTKQKFQHTFTDDADRLVLRDETGQIVIVWKTIKQSKKDKKVQCLLFINDSQLSSLKLINEGMQMAKVGWPSCSFIIHLNKFRFPKEMKKILEKSDWKLTGHTLTGLEVYTFSWLDGSY